MKAIILPLNAWAYSWAKVTIFALFVSLAITPIKILSEEKYLPSVFPKLLKLSSPA